MHYQCHLYPKYQNITNITYIIKTVINTIKNNNIKIVQIHVIVAFCVLKHFNLQ